MLSAARLRERRGFTLVEVLVGVVLVSLLAGVIVPRVLGRLGQGEAAAHIGTFTAIHSAVQEFKNDLGRYPTRMGHLTSPPPAGSLDACNWQIPDLDRWRGPYLERVVPATGLRSGSAVILNSFSISSFAPATTKTLTVTASGVDRAVADRVEATVDGDASFTTGTIRWVPWPDGSERGELRYVIPIRGC